MLGVVFNKFRGSILIRWLVRWLLRWLHRLDYAYFLPLLARLPLPLSFALGGVRGKLNAVVGRDWRSVALETRHIWRMSLEGYQRMPVLANHAQRVGWTKQRFEVESREELEGAWVAAKQLPLLSCTFPSLGLLQKRNKDRGLIMLTPHMDSFLLGIAFLGQETGWRVNSMSSAISKDPRLDAAVARHFDRKYRGLEHYLNGGLVIDMEVGLRPFYRMLERHETLVVLADAPAAPKGASMDVHFLGGVRTLAGGALRLAQHTQSDVGGFICRHKGMGQYQMDFCALGAADDPQTIDRIYRFFSESIVAEPGKWWAADMLPHMPLQNAQ